MLPLYSGPQYSIIKIENFSICILLQNNFGLHLLSTFYGVRHCSGALHVWAHLSSQEHCELIISFTDKESETWRCKATCSGSQLVRGRTRAQTRKSSFRSGTWNYYSLSPYVLLLSCFFVLTEKLWKLATYLSLSKHGKN